MKKRQGATAKEVAAACGVSQATVSYVINNTEGKRVSEGKRQEILEAARQMNYFPNASAKSMRKQDSTSVGLMAGNNYTNTGFADTLLGIKRHLDENGYTVTLMSDTKDTVQSECLRYYHSGIICGVIIISFDAQSVHVKVLQEHHIPYVIISENGVYCQGMEEQRAFENVIRDCIRFCRDHDLMRIRYFTRQIKDKLYHNKFDLVVNAVQELYPESDFERIICHTQADRDEEIVPQIQEYLGQHDFDIAISPNQRLGLLMQNCILKSNFTVPQQIKHICLATSPLFQTIYPQITSIHIPLFEMGTYAAKLLLSMIEETPLEQESFECILIHGDSTRLK